MTVSPTLNLTPARCRALEALAATHPRPGRYSNTTEVTGGDRPRTALVHWQAADWLMDQWMIRSDPRCDEPGRLILTLEGRKACDDAGITVGS